MRNRSSGESDDKGVEIGDICGDGPPRGKAERRGCHPMSQCEDGGRDSDTNGSGDSDTRGSGGSGWGDDSGGCRRYADPGKVNGRGGRGFACGHSGNHGGELSQYAEPGVDYDRGGRGGGAHGPFGRRTAEGYVRNRNAIRPHRAACGRSLEDRRAVGGR